MIRGYYFITDSNLSKKGIVSDVKSAVAAKTSVIQYREKISATRQMIEQATELKKICKDSKLIINNRLDVAIGSGADGIHIGSDDVPYEDARRTLGRGKIIGVTVHNLDEALDAESRGADYLGVSPIFSTTTKQDAGLPCGVGLIREIKEKVKIPIVAIGGITLDNAREVLDAGADALCSISAVVTKDDVKMEIEKFQELFV
ncbi:thiamine phosphate synthase [Thermoproteota archaeon]